MPSAAVYGCRGLQLSDDERRFFEDADPLGFILFARNINKPDQVYGLIEELRTSVGRCAPVLIDQEGGRIQRLRSPFWREAPPMARFGELYQKDPAAAEAALRLNMALLGAELMALGIDVDCAPVLDVPVPGSHDIIGDRALSNDPAVVAALASAACEGLSQTGVVPVIKHIPGHGRATADSHEKLPRVDADRETLMTWDFLPFKAVAAAPVFAMTAHVVYSAYDEVPATVSPKVIQEVIRGEIGFQGLLMSDDLNMKALSGSLGQRAEACLGAGCDIALHCSGNLNEMVEVAGAVPGMSERAVTALTAVDAVRNGAGADMDIAAAQNELEALLSVALA